MSTLFRLLIFFSFFPSFAIFNIPSAQWGLQVSWFLALIIFVMYPFVVGGKYRFPANKNFKLISGYFFTIIGISIVALTLLKAGAIKPGEFTVDELMERSIPHIIYLIFDYLVYFYVVCYLYNSKNKEKDIRTVITYLFYFVILWGVYQWITTFRVVPYFEIFNNNESTGFTYLRFIDQHRSSSIFPEPSEYAYFLGFMFVFVFHQFRQRKQIMPDYSHHSWLMLLVWMIGVMTCQSMSLFAVLPFIFIYVYSRYVKLTPAVLIGGIMGVVILLGGVVVIEFNRVVQIFAGEDGSVLVRMQAFVDSYELFVNSPIVGVGFGAIRGLDLLGFLLSTTGLLGTIWFAIVVFKLKAYSQTNLLFIQGMKAMLIVTLISNPIMDHVLLWVIFAFITVPLNTTNDEDRLRAGALQS